VLVAGVELGGTKSVCSLATGVDDVCEEIRIETGEAGPTLDQIARTLARWHATRPLAGLGIASFGPLNLDARQPGYGRIGSTPKPGWSEVDLLAPLRALCVPVSLDTDVNGAALAERCWGAAQGLDHFVYVTVGTGIGVGTIVHGRPIRGAGHSEAGHLRVGRLVGDTWPGACPFHGDCVEGLASGPAIAARVGRSAQTLSQDDPAWESVAAALAGLLHDLALTVAPERILVGGGVADGQAHLLPRIRRLLVRSLGGYAHAARIGSDVDRYVCAPALGRRAGPLGAIALALQAAAKRPQTTNR
jgi:fructokinase